jgi:ferredoxin, 2Fe-2S
MPLITYIESTGQERTLELKEGLSVMEGAVRAGIPGIVAECGGACSCATCHVYVDESWVARVGGASQTERAMLEYAHEPRPNSRLSCQITVSDALDGLLVQTPSQQG